MQSDLKCIDITDDTLKVLDQLKLPNIVEYVDILNTKDAWSVIKEMKVRGAPLISVVALQGLKVDLLKNKEIHEDVDLIKKFLSNGAEYLKTSRPTAVNLANDLDDLIRLSSNYTDSVSLLKGVLDFIQKNLSDYENSSYEIARHGADLILNDSRFSNKSSISILTICNTGKLAMPGIGTALGIIREIKNRKKLKKLYIPETRPYNQGSRLTAFEALVDNLPGTLISDSMIGMLMKNGMVDCVIVGADRITKLGYTANKIGTFTFSVVAKRHNIPFYVSAPTSTIDLNMNYGSEIIIEERPADELRKIHNIYLAPKDIPCWNPSFDVTPPNFIEAIITEKGCYEHDKNSVEWHKMSTEQVENYLKEIELLSEDEEATISDVADGNLNYVYRVDGENKSYCIKQALPWVKCVGTNWPLDLKRVLFESEALKYQMTVCPNLVPKFIHFNDKLSLLVMEFLTDHIILRKGLMARIKYKNLGLELSNFVARTCFATSDLYLSAQDYRNKMSFWNENTLCTLTEQVIFSDPYVNAPLNRKFNSELNEIVSEIRNNPDLILAVFKLRHKFINTKQALIHGDLHSGSVMVDGKDSIKVIDPEFAFFGPIGFDTANVIAHFILSYISQRGHGGLLNDDYEEWILGEVEIFWNNFENEWNRLWDASNRKNANDEFPGLFQNNSEIFKKIKKSYIQELFKDTIGFLAVEIIRRILGVANVADLQTIQDIEIKVQREIIALKLAKILLLDNGDINSIYELIKLVRELNN